MGFKENLRQYSGRKIQRLANLPEFQPLADRYRDIRQASEAELSRAFSRSIMHEVEEALGIEGEI